MAKVTGGEVVAAMLAKEGVDTVFGIIDGTYVGLNAAFAKYGIRLIGPRHETSAAHMAGAYARVTGKLGVCIASNGPGVANILPGVAVETGEGNRVLLITTCRREGITYPDRGGTFQYFNQVAVTKPMTKWAGAAPNAARLPEFMRRAFRISATGRPGVVHVDIPENVINGESGLSLEALTEPAQYRNVAPLAPNADAVAQAAKMLNEAEFPMLHVGSGVIHAEAYSELRALAQRLRAPVVTSWGARAVLDERSRLSIPMIYLDLVKEVRNEADAALILGSRIGETDWWGKPPYWRAANEQTTIQVDHDPEILGLNRPVDLAVLSDVKVFMQELLKALGPDVHPNAAAREQRLHELSTKRAAARAVLDEPLENMDAPMHSAHVAGICRSYFDDDAILVADGGNTSVWANFYNEVREPRTFLSTFKFGMLGAGVAQALGAKAAYPDREVYCIIGDGAMGFHPQEIETAIRNELPVIYIVLCDKQWGLVKMTQQIALKPLKTLVMKSLEPHETVNADLGEIEFDKLAESMGGYGERVSKPADLKPALRRAQESGRCAVIHVDVDPVKHMWAPGLKAFKDMHQEPAG